MKRAPTQIEKVCIVFGFAVLGVVFSHYGIMWSLYGLGYVSHVSNYVGYAIVILSPLAAIFAFAAIASGRLKVDSDWKNLIMYGLCIFLTGPVLYYLMQTILYSIDPTLCGFLWPLGWG